MSITEDHLRKLGFTLEDAYAYVSSHLDRPRDIYQLSDKYDITTEMLTEIMGGKFTKDDVKKYISGHGYDTDVLDLSTAEYVAKKGANVQEIHEEIISKISNPMAIFALSKKYALTTDMLDDIMPEFDADDISEYFMHDSLDEKELDDHHSSGDTEDDDIIIVGTNDIGTTLGVV